MTTPPRSVFITGAGRSGTSMIAGLFAPCGYFQGDRLYEPRDANPKGFFEDPEINEINEAILVQSFDGRRDLRPPRRTRRLRPGQLWLAELRSPLASTSSLPVASRILALSQRTPFALKDPRFSYTLSSWSIAAPRAAVICVFRHPAVTMASTLTECSTNPYLSDVRMSARRAEQIWHAMYRATLIQFEQSRADWHFVHYDQVLSGTATKTLSDFVGVRLDAGFPEQRLKRSAPKSKVSPATLELYEHLCDLASHSPTD